MVFGQARNAFLSAVGPLCCPFGKAGLSADFTPRVTRDPQGGNQAPIGSDFWSPEAPALSTGVAEAGPYALLYLSLTKTPCGVLTGPPLEP
jgi:hypothetical protein